MKFHDVIPQNATILQSIIFYSDHCYGQDGQGSLEGQNFSSEPYLDGFSERSLPPKKYLRAPSRDKAAEAWRLPLAYIWFQSLRTRVYTRSAQIPDDSILYGGPDILASSKWNLLHVTFLMLRILWRVPDFGEICERNFSQKTLTQETTWRTLA
jgi:hypothetical protein